MNLKARQFSFTKANWRLYKAIYKTCTKYEIHFLQESWVMHWLKQRNNTLLLNGGKTRRMNFIIQCHTSCMTRQKIFLCTVFRHSMNTVDVFLLAYVHFSLSIFILCTKILCMIFIFSHLPIVSALEKTDFTFWSFMSKDIIDCSFCARICTEWVKTIASEKKWNHGMKHAFKS